MYAELVRFFNASIGLMQVMARACGHDHLGQFDKDDPATWQHEMALLLGVKFSGWLYLCEKRAVARCNSLVSNG